MKLAGRLALVVLLAFPLCFARAGFAADPPANDPAKTAPAPQPEAGAPSQDGKVSDAPPEEALGRVIKEPASFNGIKWGTKLKDLPDLKVVGEYKGVRYAALPDTVYRIGDVFINEVTYAFCADGFAAVRLEFSGRDKLDSIARIIGEKYSAPVRMEGSAERYALPLGNVLIVLDYDPKNDVGALGYSYRPIFEQCIKKGK